ncbi:MAG: CHRD domain-containing protein [Sedimentitalea sp.]|nr:CHRD domain-containing protein [Sedimentitalea sp.]
MFGKTTLMAAVALTLAAPAAFAETRDWSAELAPATNASGEVTDAKGMAEGTVDTETGKVTWTVTYEGLTGQATAMHFHGPAAEGEDAPVALPIDTSEGSTSPVEGEAEATPDQIAEMEGGQWYVNVHTEANPGGEIRGQVTLAE